MNRRPRPYQGRALPLSYLGKARDGTRTRDPQLGRLMLCQTELLSHSKPWRERDSNPRTHTRASLQPASFGHSDIPPKQNICVSYKLEILALILIFYTNLINITHSPLTCLGKLLKTFCGDPSILFS